MKRKFLIPVLISTPFLCLCIHIYQRNYTPTKSVDYTQLQTKMNKEADLLYGSLTNLCGPTQEDYKQVESYLQNEQRPFVDLIELRAYRDKSKKMRLASKHQQNIYKIIPVNTNLEERNNCILLYCTWNELYPKSVETLLSIIKKSNFVGHVIYRVGGFPGEQYGDLSLAHIPFSFKVCAFMEAYRLGYKQALWLDAPIRPHIDLNTIFQRTREKGLFCYYDTTKFTQYCKAPHNYQLIDLSREMAEKLFTVALGIVGINFTDYRGLSVLHEWYYETKYNPKSSFTAFVETTILSKIINKYYQQKDFRYFLSNVYCPQHGSATLLEPNSPKIEFSYNKLDVEPNWPSKWIVDNKY